ncbi:MAG: putative aminohydrolase SsnA [Synergistaceae bacterium]|nr:putative aminohydrolase SsnA [Synergistaceae bacterium]
MLLVGNGALITRDPEMPFIADGCAAINGSSINQVGPTKVLREKYPAAKFIDAKGGLIMPGFINSHMHIYSVFSRGMNVPGEPAEDFSSVLEKLWWRLDKALTLRDVYYSAMTAMIEAIKCGCTTMIDHHASPFAVSGSLRELARGAKDTGLRLSACYEVSDRDGQKIAYEGIRENVSFIDWAEQENDPMISGKFGLHASFTLSDQTLEKCREAMEGRGNGFHVHVAESAADEAQCVEKHGARVVRRFHDFGLTGKNSVFVHCIHIDDEERELLKETDTAVVHNPESNMGNAVGAANVAGLAAAGVTLGLGTDGYLCDMLQSYKMGNALCKHAAHHPNKGWGELPAMLFENNAEIAERAFPVKLGRLKAGYAADLIVLDYLPPTELNEKNINGHLLFGASARSVITTIAGGKVLMRDRKLVELDAEEIFAKARECASELWKRL